MGDSLHEFDLSDEFFSFHPESEKLGVLGGNLSCQMRINKLENTFDIEAHLQGEMRVVCDRCQTEAVMDVEADYPLVVRLGQEFDDNMDEEIIIPHTDARLDLNQILYEWAILSLPMVKGHPEGECPEEFEALYRNYAPRSDQEENPSGDEIIDERWQALAQLKQQGK